MTPEERIEAAAVEQLRSERSSWPSREGSQVWDTPEQLWEASAQSYRDEAMEAARKVLAAAYPEDFPPKPKWPSDESVIASHIALGSRPGEASFEMHRERLRLAFLADPIIKAVAEWKAAGLGHVAEPAAALRRAIDEAGL